MKVSTQANDRNQKRASDASTPVNIPLALVTV